MNYKYSTTMRLESQDVLNTGLGLEMCVKISGVVKESQ